MTKRASAKNTTTTPKWTRLSDAVTRPSKPYVDMSFGMGKSGLSRHFNDAACGEQVLPLAQREDRSLLPAADGGGVGIRLPGWDHDGVFVWRRSASELPKYGWFFDNSNSKYQKVGKKKPNPWGLYDMHGNVTEWVLDQYDADYYKICADKGVVTDPWNKATKPYPHAARGGSWDDDPPALRSAHRLGSERSWKRTDPQLPKGKWYFTDAQFIGFRIVRPLAVPSPAEMEKYWISGVEKE